MAPSDRPGPALTIVVPCYNSEAYLATCLDSMLPEDDLASLEVLVVNDGSRDGTAEIAQSYAERFPQVVRVIDKENGGHGSAINTGLEHARGRYLKIVDSDDWLNPEAFAQVRQLLATFDGVGDVDVVVTNFVYEKVERRRSNPVRYTDVLPQHRVFGWQDVGKFGKRQYMLMHSLLYRTELLRECGLRLPEHSFYVDNLYAYLPLLHVRTMYYLNVDLYRYYIGRPGQSVNESVMLSRIDQQLAVNKAMLPTLQAARRTSVPLAQEKYLLHYFEIVSAVSSILLIRAGSREAMAKRDAFWEWLRTEDLWLYDRLQRSVLVQLTNLPGRPGRGISVLAYKAAQWAVGFN